MGTRDELVAVLSERYARSDRWERGRILEEFVEVTGFHRKHAMRVLRGGRPDRRSGPRPERRVYDEAARQALILIWEASDRICGKRLQPLIPILVESMERHGHLRLAPAVRADLLTMSAATIDRALVDEPALYVSPVAAFKLLILSIELAPTGLSMQLAPTAAPVPFPGVPRLRARILPLQPVVVTRIEAEPL